MQTKKIDEKKVAAAEKTMISCLDDFERVWLAEGTLWPGNGHCMALYVFER